MSIESLIEFAQLAQKRKEFDVSAAQKQILNEQLAELDTKIQELQKVRELLLYKIETYDEHLAKFNAGEMSKENMEKLWEKEF